MPHWKGKIVVAGVLLLTALAGCERQGPAERTGEKIDEAARDLGRTVEETADSIRDCVEEDDRNC